MRKDNLNKLKGIQTQADAVIHYIRHLDLDMIDTLLDGKYKYQDFSKNIFIQKLGIAFDEFIHTGDFQLEVNNGFCSQFICNNQCSGFRFSGKKSGLYFDLIIEVKNGVVKDIYECSSFMCLSAELNAVKRVLIDRTKYDFKFNPTNRDF